MRKITVVAPIVFLGILLFSGSVLATSYTMDYWAPASASTEFSITLESAAFESSFGLFAFEDPENRVQVFDKNENPGVSQTIYFRNTGGWEIRFTGFDDSIWQPFAGTFGFYFEVYTGGTADTLADYLWFTDKRYNQDTAGGLVDTDIEHVRTTLVESNEVKIELDDQPGGGDRDWNDMVVSGSNVKPVPEPATMMLMGFGLIGLAGVFRKKPIAS